MRKLDPNTVVSAAAILVAVAALIRTDSMSLDAAREAQAEPPPAVFSAGEQRQRIIAELAELNGRIAKLESTLQRGLDVRVTELPDSGD